MAPTRRLESEKTEVQKQLLDMSNRINNIVRNVIDCLIRQDNEKAEEIVKADVHINELQRSIEEACLEAIATQQPVASDLRAIIASMHIASELERMADHAADIAKIVLKMADETPIPSIEIKQMMDQCCLMLEHAMEAYLTRDTDLAYTAAKEDDVIDRLENQIVEQILSGMCADPSKKLRDTHLLWVAYNLERIGDRVTNIAEQVIFMKTGKILDLN